MATSLEAGVAGASGAASPFPRRARGAPRWTGATPAPRLIGTRAAAAALWLLVAASAASGLASLAMRPARPPQIPPAPTPRAVEGFAELYVAAFLADAGEASADAIKAFYPATVDLRGMAAGTKLVTRTVVVASSPVAPHYWSVTVAADVMAASAGGYQQAGTRFLRVGVASRQGALVATSLPSEVSAPPAAASAPPVPLDEAPQASGPPAEAVAHFLSALLAGQGELARYTSASSELRPVTPAPYSQVTLRSLELSPAPRDAGNYQAKAQAEAQEAGGVMVLDYFLKLHVAQGRWEIEDLLPAAPLPPGHNPERSERTGT